MQVFYRDFFLTGTPPKSSKYKKVNPGVSRPIYVNVDSPNLGFPYFNFLGGTSEEKNTLYNTPARLCYGALIKAQYAT